MKITPRAQCVRRRLALLLLVSTINFIAAPFLLASRSAAAPDEPTDFVRRINLTTNDLIFSSATGRIYASVPSSAGSSGNSLQAIDPTTGLVTSTTFVGSEPNKLAISDDGQSLYVSLDGSFSIRRFDTQTNTPGLQFPLGSDFIFGRYSTGDLAVAPGNPGVLAVARVYATVSPPEAGVAIFDDGVRRTNTGPNHSEGSDFLAYSASAAKLYGTGQASGLKTMAIDAQGVTVSSSTTLASGARIKFSGGKLFSSAGQVINPDSNTLLGTFFGVNTQAFVPDAAAGRAYYVTSGPGSSVTLKAFDINTFVQLSTLVIDNVSGTPTSLLRWGPNGLAFRTNNNQLFIIQTALIPSAEPIPTPTPVSSPTPSPSPSSAAVFTRTIPLTANDLVYNQTTQRLYASVPSSEGSSGNSLAEIDPVMGSITSQTFVGSEPTQLALADDNQTLYVGLDGAASLRSYNIISHTPGAQFPVGRDNSTGPYSFTDIAVSPGNPLVVAVCRQQRSVSPPEAGVAIFDNGVQRTKTGPGHIEGSDFVSFASPTTLYGNSFDGLTKMTVASDGVTVNGTTPFRPGNGMILANGLLYGASGQIINPSTDQIVGTFSNVAPGSTHVIDVANNRAFFINTQGGPVQIKAYDLNTFLPVGFANISGVGGPGSLVRWGVNGLAFRTVNRQVVLVETALVNDSVPIPNPTPTPIPTPSPTPPYIPTFIRRVNLPANDLVYSAATQALYASVPSSAGANGNSITKITPATAVVGPSTFIGSEPAKMAISDDGQTIWVHLNGANAARRFEVVSQTPGLQFNTGVQSLSDMEVVPGSPQSVALTKTFSSGVFIYDDGVQRPNTGNFFPTVGPIEFAGPSVLYGFNGSSSSFDLVKYLVNANGVTQSTSISNLLGGVGMEYSNGLLYSGGRVVDPEAGTLVGTFVPVSFPSAIALDAANHRIFEVGSSNGSIILQAFDTNTFLPVGSVTIPFNVNSPFSLVRWGANGLAFTTQNQFSTDPGQVFLLQTELVSNAAPIPTGVQFDLDKFSVFESGSALVKVSRTGDVSGTVSVDFATSDGTATAGSDYTAMSGTLTFAPGELSKNISVPITNDTLFENSNETFTVTLSNPTSPAILTTSSTTVTINDNDSKPFVFLPSPIRVSEGDLGNSNVAVSIRLTNPTVQTVTVDYTTSDRTGTAGSDYVATSGNVTIPAGSTSVTVNIPITGDTTIEPDETFAVMLSNATNVSFIANSEVLVTIANDDATMQFNNATFGVNEGAGFATVTVTRAGDTTRAATVQYATTDTAGLQNCTVANGKASERCDYATAVGRVQFAIGETIKTFTIPIIDDAIVEGDETLTVSLNGPAGALLGATSTATITITDNDTTPATQNPIDGVTPFITQQYIDFLGRLPDTIGLDNWILTLAPCPNSGFGEFDHPECDRVHVSAGFFLSDEFRGRGYFAYKFYEVGFDRRPAYVEFVPDMALVGGPQSPQSEVISKQIYTDAFVQRPEFKNRYDALSNSAYVDALETNAEVTLANKAALVAALDGNQKTRAQVLREIVELPSVTDKFFIRAFVAMQYFGYLRRDPDTVGYDNWVATLTADPSNFRHMIFGFIYSDEYRHRFGP